MRLELIQKWMSSRHKLMVFLVAAVSFLANNLAAFLIIASLIDGYTLIAPTDGIVTSSFFIFSSSSLSFRAHAWTMETRE